MKPDSKRELITGETDVPDQREGNKMQQVVNEAEEDYDASVKADTAMTPPANHQSSREMTPRERSNANLRAPYPKGVSGNPLGRPKNDKCITSILRRKLNETDDKGVTWAERITDAMLAKAASTDSTKGTASVLKEVLERTEGKVPDQLQIESHNVSIEYVPARYLDSPSEE